MTPEEVAALIQQIQAHTLTMHALQERAVNALSAYVRPFRAWYDHQAIRSLAEGLASLLGSFEKVAAREADSYMTGAISAGAGRRVPPAGVRNTPLGREGVENAEVMGRVADTFRFAQSEWDKNLRESVRSGRLLDKPTPDEAVTQKLTRLVETNLHLAERNQYAVTMAGSDLVTGYRRMIHPELAREGTCGLCIAASDRRYHKATLLPIHPGCHCTVLPIVGDLDPHVINEIDFSQIYSDAGDTSAESLRQTRYRIDQHGEIGPVIRPSGEPIRSEREAKSTDRRRKPKSNEEKIHTLTRKRDALQADRERVAGKIKGGEIDGANGDALVGALDTRVMELSAEIRRLGGQLW